jgi:glutamine amidotransferase
MIAVLDYGLGNVGSIVRMFNRLGKSVEIVRNKKDIKSKFHLVLPGVGSFDAAINKLRDLDLVDVIVRHAEIGNPILGICLGMQLLCHKSEEGFLPGLGLVNGVVKKLPFIKNEYLVPNMGWKYVQVDNDSALFKASESSRFYFVHSYFVDLNDPSLCTAYCQHSVRFCAGFQKNNILGVQFHPEKSHRYGMKILESFAQIKE